jgi:predicted heme/steroid binding protein
MIKLDSLKMKNFLLANQKIIIAVLISITIVNLAVIYLVMPNSQSQYLGKAFTAEELKQYNGTDENKPIYLAYNGDVYDVTAGKEYYNSQGVYHYLAGRDCTAELNFAGGGIIKAKYQIIGFLTP